MTDKDDGPEDEEVTFGPTPASISDALEETLEDELVEGLAMKRKNKKKKKKNKKNKKKRKPDDQQEVVESVEKKSGVE